MGAEDQSRDAQSSTLKSVALLDIFLGPESSVKSGYPLTNTENMITVLHRMAWSLDGRRPSFTGPRNVRCASECVFRQTSIGCKVPNTHPSVVRCVGFGILHRLNPSTCVCQSSWIRCLGRTWTLRFPWIFDVLYFYVHVYIYIYNYRYNHIL